MCRINFSPKPKPELTSDPAGAALTGNTVTLTCHMDPSTGWDFYWYKHTLNPEIKTETNSYRVKIDSVSDGGQYWCRAGRGKPVYYTQYSDALWVNVTDQQRNINQTSDPNQSAESQTENSPLQSDIDTAGPSDLVYAQIDIKDKKKTKGKGKSSESGDTFYSELKHNTDRGWDQDSSGSDAELITLHLTPCDPLEGQEEQAIIMEGEEEQAIVTEGQEEQAEQATITEGPKEQMNEGPRHMPKRKKPQKNCSYHTGLEAFPIRSVVRERVRKGKAEILVDWEPCPICYYLV
ncbi:Fc receptor 5 [Labeo rohita]|uniref:Fc receptor 5 n=1 Tax=Labeo rohita TaxID=84645 RepID=A0A498MV65_LABRO|nr:Fc receptor 5 [Labeo rohita]